MEKVIVPNDIKCEEEPYHCEIGASANAENDDVGSSITPIEGSSRDEEHCVQPQSSGKRRRGRPSKEETKTYKRTRESLRVKKCPTIMNYEVTDNLRCVWTAMDKLQFLKGLLKCGSDDIKGLKTYLPNKTENDIKNQIRMWESFAITDMKKRLLTSQTKVDSATVNCIMRLKEWVEHFEGLDGPDKARLFSISNIFLLFAEYAKFPSQSEVNGIDVRAMYRYLHCILNESPFIKMNQKTAQALDDSISDFFSFLRERNLISELQVRLHNLNDSKRPPKTFAPHPKRSILSMPTNPEDLLNHMDFNPLKIPFDILAKHYGDINVNGYDTSYMLNNEEADFVLSQP